MPATGTTPIHRDDSCTAQHLTHVLTFQLEGFLSSRHILSSRPRRVVGLLSPSGVPTGRCFPPSLSLHSNSRDPGPDPRNVLDSLPPCSHPTPVPGLTSPPICLLLLSQLLRVREQHRAAGGSCWALVAAQQSSFHVPLAVPASPPVHSQGTTFHHPSSRSHRLPPAQDHVLPGPPASPHPTLQSTVTTATPAVVHTNPVATGLQGACLACRAFEAWIPDSCASLGPRCCLTAVLSHVEGQDLPQTDCCSSHYHQSHLTLTVHQALCKHFTHVMTLGSRYYYDFLFSR